MTNDLSIKNIAVIGILALFLAIGAGLIVGIATGGAILGLLVGNGVAVIALAIVLVVYAARNPRPQTQGTDYMGVGIAIGVALGVALSAVAGSLAFVGSGIAIGVAIGVALNERNKEHGS